VSLRVGSLFSGIGGFDLGLERAGGFHTAWFCEQDEFCQHVLAQHWPGVPCYPDITDLRGAEVEPVDVLCGGFPCQDLSYAGAGAGLAGARSGLWSEYARLIGELRPRYVVVENVSALLARGLGVVLGDLATLGMDCEWGCIRAADVGAPHLRDRVWLVAYPSRDVPGGSTPAGSNGERAGESSATSMAYHDQERREWRPRVFGPGWWRELTDCGWWQPEPRVRGVDDGLSAGLDGSGLSASDQRRPAEELRLVRQALDAQAVLDWPAGGSRQVFEAEVLRQGVPAERPGQSNDDEQADDAGPVGEVPQGGVRAMRSDGAAARPSSGPGPHQQRSVEPRDVVRAVPQPPPLSVGAMNRPARLRSLGNALVPAIATWIGERIIDYERGVESLAA
jgi:site-specific DNA-cytosine methylase